MLKKICFVLERRDGPETEKEQEVRRALRSFAETGIEGEVLYGTPEEIGGTLFLCDSGEMLRRLRKQGFCTAGYLHKGNRRECFSGAAYVVQEPDLVDADSYEKMYQRGAGLPWRILETARCVVREFVTEDLEDLYRLYDEEAKRFLEPPSEDREREREILRAYIDRIYGLYGFGHWAVFLKETAAAALVEDPARTTPAEIAEQTVLSGNGADSIRACRETPDGQKRPVLAGRVGFSVLNAEQEREAVCLGVRGGIDADFGFLIAPQLRGTGIAFEVCSALLQYGFSQLGFARVRADADKENAASLRLLRRLGFTLLGGGDNGKQVFLLDRKEGHYDQSTFSFHAE